MAKANKEHTDEKLHTEVHGEWPVIDSKFRLIVVAGLRAKQLFKGSTPRIEASKTRRRNTSIALEEVKRGLIHFTNTQKLDGLPPISAPGEII